MLPDGPKNSSLIQEIQFFLRPLQTLDAWHQSYGDNFKLSTKNELPAIIFFSSPEAIKRIFTANPEYLSCVGEINPFKFLLGENSIFSLDGKQHQHQRRILMPPFHSEKLSEYSQIICSTTEQAISQLTPGKFFVVNSLTEDISLNVLLNVVFGLHTGEIYNQLRQLLKLLFDVLHNPFIRIATSFTPKGLIPWSPGYLVQQIDKLLYTLIAERRCEAKDSLLRQDILTMLLEARDESGKLMNEKELRDSLFTLIFAGYQTTASALSWALYWSHYLPKVNEKLSDELNSFSCTSNKSQITRLPYLSAICSETLRIYPISLIPFIRFVQKPMEIVGYQLPVKTMVYVSIYLAHHRSEVYSQPKCFKPERFLERQFSPYEYLPFGGGYRRCIGAAFAQLEIKLVLATILSRLKLTLVTHRPIKPVRRGLIMTTPNNLEMLVTDVRS